MNSLNQTEKDTNNRKDWRNRSFRYLLILLILFLLFALFTYLS